MVEYIPDPHEKELNQMPRNSYDDLPPRNSQEFANKLLINRIRDIFPELNEDFILSHITPAVMDVGSAYLEAIYALEGLKKQGLIPSDSNILENYRLRFYYMVTGGRALEGRTLDAFTITKVTQETKHKEELGGQGKKGMIRRFF